jgi:GTPase Era involved in 16S rRNA processing
LNALLGEKIAIVSAKAQTTRGRMLGVLTRPGVQILFHDTPGVHGGERKFNQMMSERALETAEGADVRALLFESGAKWEAIEERIAAPRCDRAVARSTSASRCRSAGRGVCASSRSGAHGHQRSSTR